MQPLPSSASAPSPSAIPSTSTPNASTASVHEPPWSGWIETTGDALIILEAARRGLIPRVTRRLVDAERKMITSGSVFVFDEEESGIKRWTDGLFWSASRILGNFLLYRETDKRGAGHKTSRSDTTVGADETHLDGSRAGSSEAHSLSRPRSETSRLGIDRQRERSLVGSLTNSEKFKQGGMVKKTFSLTINGVAQHLISYYKVEDIEEGRLRPPSSYPELAALDISPDFLDKTHFRLPPRVEIGFDGVPRYRGDADDIEPSPHVISAAMGSTPLLSEPLDVGAALSKRGTKRYEPYIQPPKVKRRSKGSRS
ncbi:Gti1/Pac2 family-domain-containing protein, partial [Vararia minispora EC-137]